MLSDLRYALRQLAKSPGFTAVAVLTLALGMGANTTFFSVLYGVVLRSPPYFEASRLVELRDVHADNSGNGGLISQAELFDYRQRQHSFVGIGGDVRGRATLNADHGAERVIVARTTANLFPLLGIPPLLGRTFTADEERPGADRVVILSYDCWQSNFGGEADILGRTVRLNHEPHTIVGVMPPGFTYSERGTAFWQPLDLTAHGAADRDDHSLFAVARLAPGISAAQAHRDLDRVARDLRADLPQAYPDASHWGLGFVSLRESRFGTMQTPLAALMAGAAAVLLIACVNVAIMFLLRAATRRREIMIRLALGAARRHIVRQLLAESAVVCTLGMIGGLALAAGGIELLKAFPPAEIPRLQEVALNGPVSLFTGGVLLLVTAIVGLAPAASIWKTRLNEGIAHTGRVTESRGAVRLRETLTVAEVALAVLLLVGAGLTLRSLGRLLSVNLGFTPAHLLSFKTNLTPAAYPDAARTNLFYDQLSAKIAALPGVQAVGSVSYLPLSGESHVVSVAPASDAPVARAGSSNPPAGWRIVRGSYFEAMGLPLLRGRLFGTADRPDTLPVAIVDEALARRYWPDPDAAIGNQLRFGESSSAELRTVVGVVRRVKDFGPHEESLPDAYVPQTQFYQRGMYMVVKTNLAPERLIPQVRAALASVDPSIPMYFTATMADRYDATLALPRFTAGLIGVFSALALALAGVGIFGVTAYSVGQRAREFGIRFALGAPRSHVVRLVLGRVGRLALLGAAVGAVAAFELAQLMTGLLFGIEPVDGPTLAATAAAVGLTALLASILPLARALRVNPTDVLRAE